jgi:hypothetical protein
MKGLLMTKRNRSHRLLSNHWDELELTLVCFEATRQG